MGGGFGDPARTTARRDGDTGDDGGHDGAIVAEPAAGSHAGVGDMNDDHLDTLAAMNIPTGSR
jgi:hypothetical protein